MKKKSNKKVTAVDVNGVARGIRNNGEVSKTVEKLSKLNVNRGGVHGGKGFVAEHLQVYEMNKKLAGTGLRAEVVDNNGVADIVLKKANGAIVKKYQLKMGYENKSIDVSKYVADDQTILVSKDASKKLVRSVKDQSAKVERSYIKNADAEKISENMRTEGKILNRNTSSVTTKAWGANEFAKNCHRAGKSSAVKGAAFGAGFSLANNTVDCLNGDIEVEEAAANVVVDTTIATATGYVGGAAFSALGSAASAGASAVGSTAVGAAAGGALASAGTAVTSTAIGGAVVSGTTAVAGAAVGGVATASAAITTGAAAVLGTGAAATVAVAAAPLVVAGAAIGVAGKCLSWLFDD